MKTISITTKQGKFHAQLLGERGSWVVCWPGQLHDHGALLDFANLIARDHRVMLCDIPAFGLNRELPYTHVIDDHVNYALRLLTKLGIGQFHWVGLAGGGTIGAALHTSMPSRLLSLTLASSPMLSQSRVKFHETALIALLGGSNWGRRLLASGVAQEIGYANASEKAALTQYFQQAFDGAHPKAVTRLRALDGARVRSTFDRLRIKPPPLLILTGTHDKVILPRDQSTVAEITNSQIVYLDCGHMTLTIKPQECAQAFKSFVSKHHA